MKYKGREIATDWKRLKGERLNAMLILERLLKQKKDREGKDADT